MTAKRARALHQWLFLRLAVATLVVSGGVILLTLTAENVAKGPLFACLVVQYIGIAGGVLASRMGARRPLVQGVELGLDVVLITFCVHFTGGVGSPFTLLYFFPILLAATTMRRRATVLTAVLSSAMLLGYELLVAAGRLEPPEILFRATPVDRSQLLEVHFAVGLFLISGYLAGEMAKRVDDKARLLEAKRDELARHRLETQSILDNMSSGVLSLDEEGRVLRLNPAAVEILGMPAERIKGRMVDETLGSIMPSFVTYLREALRDGNDARRIELNIMRSDTSVVPIGVSISQQYDEEGERTGIIAVFQDLTSVLRMRERMRASDRLAAVGELSAGIAHEIRNPLASIRGSVEMLSGELEVEGENRRLMELIQRESERLNRILEDFLAYARLRPQAVRNCHLGPLLDDLCTMMRRRDDLLEGATIDLILPPCDLIIEVDQEQMTQVFLNLALNALQAMAEGGRLTIATVICPLERPAEVVVRFLDEGPGIEEDALPHLFDPFFHQE